MGSASREQSNGLRQVEARVVEAQALVQGADGVDLSLRQVEAGDVEVLREAAGVVGLWDDGNAALRRPAEQHLRRRLVGPCRRRLHGRHVPQERRALCAPVERGRQLQEGLRPKGRVGRDGDVLLVRQRHELFLHEVGVVLDLQRRDGVAGVGLDVVEGLGLGVGDADGLCDAVVDYRLQCLPRPLDGNPVEFDL